MKGESMGAKQRLERWAHICRSKASEFEHEARGLGKTIIEPDLDTLANEIESFIDGFCHEHTKEN